MTARLSRNLRRGHRAELRGIDHLCSFAAVAQIPQTEDVGADCVASLLRFERGFLYAEHSFLVQVKAKSKRQVRYEGHKLQWFMGLDIPFFILRVDLDNGGFELFSTNEAYSVVLDRGGLGVTLGFNRIPVPQKEHVHRVSSGEPILKWNACESESLEFMRLAYDVMKPWLEIEQRNCALRRSGMINKPVWQTNMPPEYEHTLIPVNPATLRRDMVEICERLTKLAAHVFFDEAAQREADAFETIFDWMRCFDVHCATSALQARAAAKRQKQV